MSVAPAYPALTCAACPALSCGNLHCAGAGEPRVAEPTFCPAVEVAPACAVCGGIPWTLVLLALAFGLLLGAALGASAASATLVCCRRRVAAPPRTALADGGAGEEDEAGAHAVRRHGRVLHGRGVLA